jgi:hypothetical protein
MPQRVGARRLVGQLLLSDTLPPGGAIQLAVGHLDGAGGDPRLFGAVVSPLLPMSAYWA